MYINKNLFFTEKSQLENRTIEASIIINLILNYDTQNIAQCHVRALRCHNGSGAHIQFLSTLTYITYNTGDTC